MSHFFGARGAFGQPLLQSLLGPNNNPTTTQQYLEVLNYYKNLGTYADLNSYSALMNQGRLPGASPSTSAAAANPLAALGDLSMYGLTSPALPAASTMNLANSVLAGSMPQLQTPASSASMYTSVAPSMLASTASNAGLTNTTNSAALSAFEQYTQNLRGTFPNMYSYASDFGLGSSGSTILDKSKSNKKQSTSNSNGGKNTTNLPGGSSKSNNNSMSLYPGSSTYITPHPQQQHLPQHQQQQQQQQHQSHQSQSQSHQSQSQLHQSQSRPNSRNTPIETSKSKSKTTTSTMSPTSGAQNPNTTTSPSAATTSSVGKSTVTVKELISSVKTNTPDTGTSSLINYRRSDSSSSNSNSLVMKQSQKKIDLTVDSPPSASIAQKTTTPTSTPSTSNATNSKQQMGKTLTTTAASNQKPSLSKSSTTSKPSLNMGILYPNSKSSGNESHSPTSSKSKSPMNMGIVYPRSQQKSSSSSNSEMQIIPTSSPPGTTSISKQLNELSPSISLTAVKNTTTATNKPVSTIAKASTGVGPTNIQINKVLQNNTTIRRTISPVRPNGSPGGGTQKTPTSNNNNASGNNSFSARMKANNQNNQKKTTVVNSSNPPPLHRANTTLGTTTSSTVNINTKTSSGLTITNVKTPIKATNLTAKPQTSSASINQVTTLAKQQAAASVAKSSIQRAISTAAAAAASNSSSSLGNNKTPNDLQKSTSSPALPSLTSIKKTIIKRQLSNANSGNNNKLPPLTASPNLTVTSSNKGSPITSSGGGVKSLTPSMATISRTQVQGSKTNTMAVNKQNLPTMANVTKTLSQMQKRPIQLATSTSTSQSGVASTNTRNAVNIRPVDTNQNPTGSGSSVYIIETNINDKKVAIGAPTKSGGGTTVTKVSMQNPNKRKANDAPSKDNTGEIKRPKN